VGAKKGKKAAKRVPRFSPQPRACRCSRCLYVPRFGCRRPYFFRNQSNTAHVAPLLYKRDSVLEAERLDRLCEIEMIQLLRVELSPSTN